MTPHLNTSPESRKELASARKRALFSVFLNTCLAAGKGAAGVLSGSAALVGDALHSATDVLGSGAAYIGLWLAGRRHPSFPYGMYKAETLATVIISVVVILAAYEIGRFAVFGTPGIPDVALALPVALASLAVTVAFGLSQLRSGRRLGSPALIADARDYLADGLSTCVVVAGLVAAYFGLHVERFAAAGVSLFVFWSGGSLLLKALRELMDAGMDQETRLAVVRFVESHPQVRLVERCVGRSAGGRFIVDLDVVLRTGSHETADMVADRLEEELFQEFPRIAMVHIRTHHGHSRTLRRITPATGPEGETMDRLGDAPYFRIDAVDRETGKITDTRVLENPHAHAERKRGFFVGRWLLSLKPDEVYVGKIKESTAVLLLEEAGIKLLEKEP